MIKYIPQPYLDECYVMLDFICTSCDGKQAKKIYLHRESKQRLLAFQPGDLDHSVFKAGPL